jgi:ribosome-binding factor A
MGVTPCETCSASTTYAADLCGQPHRLYTNRLYSRDAMPSGRMRRINEMLREVVGAAIASDLNDPRIGFVTVTSVETSPDLRSARVYVSVLGGAEEREASLAGLRSSHGVIQARIGRETRMKRTPTLSFEYDEAIERGMRISRLLDSDR